MRREVVLLAAAALSHVALTGCGSSSPREADIYHDPALRPGVVETADGAEQALLSRLGEVAETDVVIDVGARTFAVDRAYHAASGRWCRSVRSSQGESRLACRTDEGWAFVPQVLPTGPIVGAGNLAADDTVEEEPR